MNVVNFDAYDLPSKGGYYARVNALKERQENLKVLLSLGGWNAGTAIFKVAFSILKFLVKIESFRKLLRVLRIEKSLLNQPSSLSINMALTVVLRVFAVNHRN